MAIRANKYNDPAIGAAFENIAQMFAPPGAADLANYSLARERNQRADIVARLAQDPNNSGFDHQAILADLFDPTQSFYKVDLDSADTRRGQDVSAQTSILNNAADNRTSLVSDMFGPLSEDQVRPDLPADIAGTFDLPALPAVQGNPSPLSETEWDAAQKQRLLLEGELTDDDILAAINSDIPVENIVGEGGAPVIMRRADAVGEEPFFNKGAEAKPQNAAAVLPDGRQVPAVQGPDNTWLHAQTGERLPDDIRIFDMPKAQGTAADVGLSKPTDTYIEKQLIDIAVAKDTAVTLRDLISSSPASQGVVGWLRGTAQNVIATGGELGEFFGGNVADVAADIEAGLADAELAGAFDPNIPAIDMLANLLAFQYAKTTTGERLSNEMLRASRAALGLNGLDANQANSLARLNQAIAQIQAQEDILNGILADGIGGAPPSNTTTDGVPEGIDPADWEYLTPDEQAEYLNGQ